MCSYMSDRKSNIEYEIERRRERENSEIVVPIDFFRLFFMFDIFFFPNFNFPMFFSYEHDMFV